MSQTLSRRQALLAFSLSLSGVVALALTGCGSGSSIHAVPIGGGGPSVGTGIARGRVVLSPGSTVSAANLTLTNGLGSATTSADGTFSLNVLNNAPTISLVLDAAGHLVLFGFVDPSAGAAQNEIGTLSTATALLYFALGGGQAPIEVKKNMLGLIRTEEAAVTLAQAISDRLVAVPFALEQGDATIQQALKTATDAIKSKYMARSYRGGQKVTRQAGITPQLLVTPTEIQSGVEVLQDSAKQGAILPINHQRRECKLFAYRVGYEDDQGTPHDLTKAEALNLGDSLPATAAIGGVWTTIGELITGSTALSPVTGKSVPLTMRTGDVKTYCEVVVVGSAFTQSEPSFFTEARYADQVGLWRDARQRLNLISWLRDLVFGLLLEVLGVRAAAADLALYEAVALAWEEIDDLALRAVIGAAKRGELSGALADLVRLGLEPGSAAVLQKMQGKAATLLATVAGEKAAISETLWATGFKALGSLLLGVPGIILGAIDLGAVVADMADAPAGDIWSAILVKPTVKISPSTERLSKGKELNLTASIPGSNGGTFVYKWTLAGSSLASLRGDGKTGMSIETSTSGVTLSTTPSTQGALTVTVQAYRVGDNGQRELLGDAVSTITMISASTDRNIVVEYYDTGAFPTGSGNFKIAEAFITFPISTQNVTGYQITTNSTRYGGPDTYRIETSNLGEALPEDKPITADSPKVYWYRIGDGVNNGFSFYHRGDKIYLLVETEGFYGDPTGSLARVRSYAETVDVEFEIIP